MKQKSSVEWLYEKYNYVICMRNRHEISAGIADEWRKHYLQKAIQMHEEEIIAANEDSSRNDFGEFLTGDQYYNKIYGNKSNDHAEQHIEMVSEKTEISDEEIKKQSKYWNETTNPDMWTFKLAWEAGAIWYREQLKNK